ncbi:MULTISPECIES: ATP-binding protein [unclassified Variovorax]|uniref:sensor histidine kinase n=1 Tax=unclassified Variovorax TaxID=663243 RepID=UPI00076BFF74|nr:MULTISPECIES: ATP-binding protein [unclassified Variovorax]KWT94346.1 Copper sensory histidine kinase CpxA [Variovorax sp. WDL1]PNG59061.1 Sensor protein RstB [Variovorax sp. B4]PNG61148.1 Sensor protein RstB [Variovorax sp. B2]VTV12889.1 Sensor protein RstB [Variovorax sp. WDL1]
MLLNLYRRHLYVRIWLAVVGGVVILTLCANWIVREAAENERERLSAVPREVVVLDGKDRAIGVGSAVRVPGQGLEFEVTLEDGRAMSLRVAPRPRPTGSTGLAAWRTPFGLGWMIALVGVAVALGVYPIVRKITKRLETLQRGVQRWGEGDLSVRVAEDGQDEVADLSNRFNSAAARVEELVRSHKSLLANASHELRSPLARIRMGLELMSERPSPTARDEIARNIAELDQLIDEILLASRLDAKEADMGTVESVDLTGLAAEECARVDAELDVAENASSEALTVRGVPRLLRRAIRNLLENARRYGAGEISVELGSRQGTAEIRVNDRGPGVPAALRDRIFEPFYRLPGASERNGGVGLGLALVKSITERHGGSVRCEDRPGGGASFVIALPKQA